MKHVQIPEFYFPDPEDTVTLNVICEPLTDEEAREYADLMSAEEARARLQELLNEAAS